LTLGGPAVAIAAMARVLALLALAVLLAGGPYLGARELRYEEGRRAWPARELLEGGDFVVPRALGAPYLAKPPGFPLAVAGVSKAAEALGLRRDPDRDPPEERGPVTPGTLRFTNLLGLLALAASATAAARQVGGDRRTALFAGLLVVLAPEVLNKARLGEIDPCFAALCSWAALWAHRSAGPSGLSLRPLAVAGLLLVAATWTKGPLALAFGLAPLLSLTLVEAGGRRSRLLAALLLGTVALAALGLWAALVARRLDLPAADLERLWRGEILRPDPQSIGSYLSDRGRLIFGGALGSLPGSLALLALFRGPSRRALLAQPAVRLAAAALVPPLVLLLVWPAVRVRYALPLVPWIALAGSAFFAAPAQAAGFGRIANAAQRGLAAVLGTLGLAAVALLSWRLGQGADWSVSRLWPGIAALAAAVLTRRLWIELKSGRSERLLATCLALGLALRQAELCLSEPPRWDRAGVRAAARAIDAAVGAAGRPAPLFVDHWGEFNALFFVATELRFVRSPDELEPGALLLSKSPAPPGFEALPLDPAAAGLGFWLHRRAR
jgi:4-amino-4-deoxy-L-arabinose transferase-like glycosyltransferase